jgi:NlpC/P60 family
MKMLPFGNFTRLVTLSCGFLVIVLFAHNALGRENHRKLLSKLTLDPDTSSDTDRQFFEETQTYLGTKYKKGGNSKAGIDCSGFVRLIYEKVFGVDLPRNASAQHKASFFEKVSLDSLRTGDLIFFSSGSKKKRISHVGIYLANGEFIHAATRDGVTISNLNDSYWKARTFDARRMVGSRTLPTEAFHQSFAGLSYSLDERNNFSLLLTEDSPSPFGLEGMDYSFKDNLPESYRGIALDYNFELLKDSWSAHVISFRDYYLPGQGNPLYRSGLEMEASDPSFSPANDLLEAPYVEGFKVASPIRPNGWLTINPSIVYFANAYRTETRDLPRLSMGLDVVLASSADRWSFSTGFQYPLGDHFDTSLGGLSNDQGFDLSLTYRQWLSNNAQLSIAGENRTNLYPWLRNSSSPLDTRDPRFSLMLHFFY